MASKSTQVGHFLAKALGIKLQNKEPYDEVTRGESILSIQTAETFVEEPPRTIDYFLEFTPTWRQFGAYLLSLFPFLSWIGHYNLKWVLGDLVAGKTACPGRETRLALTRTLPGITIGAVVVPQGMAYAQLAQLEVQFGLYSSFMGVLIYWFFATSKDITIGVSWPSALKTRRDSR
jgi:sodium-independent sulfate anion transporter 11